MTVIAIILILALVIVAGFATSIETYTSRIEPFDYSSQYISFDDDEYAYEYESTSCGLTEYYQDQYELVETAIYNQQPSITIESNGIDLTWGDIGVMEYGFIVDRYSISHYETEGQEFTEYSFTYYSLTPDEITYMKQQIDDKIAYIASLIPAGSSAYEIALTVHSYLVLNLSYDTSLTRSYNNNVYSLIEGYAICSGYASAYAQVMNALGVNCRIISNGTHAFNQIGTIDGYIDCCWDDYDDGIIQYTYFGMSYDQLSSIPDHFVEYISYNEADEGLIIPYYYEAEGYALSEYDYNDVVSIITDQINKGIVRPSIYFTNSDAYENCKAAMSTEAFWNMVSDSGYCGPCNAVWDTPEGFYIWAFM